MTFHISTAGNITGPHDAASVRALLEAGAIHRHTRVRAEGTEEWVPLENWDAELLAPPKAGAIGSASAGAASDKRHLQSVFMQSRRYSSRARQARNKLPAVIAALVVLFAGGGWLIYHYFFR